MTAPGGLPTVLVKLDDGTGTFPYDITQYVRTVDGITIARGRADEFSQITPSTLTLVVENIDSRFSAGSGTYGIAIDRMIRVTYTVGATTSNRFTGFLTALPTSWPDGSDQYAVATLTAVDVLTRLSRRRFFPMIAQEILADLPTWYWPCTETAPATAAGDRSGHGGTILVPTSTGILIPTALEFGGGTLGVDGLPAVQLNAGQYLAPKQALALGSSAAAWTFEFEFFTTTATQALATVGMAIVSTMTLSAGVLNFASASGGSNLADGATHHVAYTYAAGVATLYVDGVSVGSPSIIDGGSAAPTFILGLAGTVFSGAIGQAAFYTTALSGARIASHANGALNGFNTERSDQRVSRLAGYANVTNLALEVGVQTNVPAQSTDGANPIDAMNTVGTSEGGLLFIRGDGALVLQNRNHRALKTTPDWTLTTHDIDPGTQPAADMQGVSNYVTSKSAVTGAQQVASDAASLNQHDYYSTDLDLLVASDAEALDRAWWLVNNYSQPRPRMPSVKVDILTQPQAVQQVALARELSDWVEITGLPSQTPGGSTTVDLYIEGWSEVLKYGTGTDPEWSMTFNSSNVANERAWILGDATYGQLGVTTRLHY